MKKENANSFIESDGVRILANKLESTRTIRTYFSENDKTPLFDGHINLINKKNEIIKECRVQIKSTEKLSPLKIGENKGKYHFDFDKEVLESVRKKITNDIVIYFVVDITNKKIFYKILTTDFLVSLDFINKKSNKIKCYLEEKDILNDVDIFYRQICSLSESIDYPCYKSQEEMIQLQKAMNAFYEKLEQINFIKKSLWPNLWKFGIKISNNKSIDLIHKQTGANLGGNCSVFAIYPIQYGNTKPEIMDYIAGKEDLFTSLDFIGNLNPNNYLDNCLEKIVDFYFDNVCCLEIVSNNCLFEIIYSFLFEASNNKNLHPNYVLANSTKIDELIQITRPYFDSLTRILEAKDYFDIKNNYDMYFVSFVLNNKVTFNRERINKILVLYFAVEECKKRNISIITQVHNERIGQIDICNYGILEEELDKLLNEIDDEVKECLSIIPSKFCNPLAGEYVYEMEIEKMPFVFCNYRTALVSQSTLPVVFKKAKIDDTKHYLWRCSSAIIDDLFRSGTPLFYLVKTIIKESICRRLSIKSNGVLVGTMRIDYPFK